MTQGSWWTALFVALLALWFGRGYVVGLINVIFVREQHVDIQIEDNALGFMAGKERWYFSLDGLTAVRDLEGSVWTIQHWNGAVLNIPKEILASDGLDWTSGGQLSNHFKKDSKPNLPLATPSFSAESSHSCAVILPLMVSLRYLLLETNSPATPSALVIQVQD